MDTHDSYLGNIEKGNGLDHIKDVLDSEGFVTQKVDIGEDSKLSTLYVGMAYEDNEETLFYLQLTFLNDILDEISPPNTEEGGESEENLYYLTINTVLPHKVKNEIEMLKTMNLINRQIPLGSYFLSTVDNLVCFGCRIGSSNHLIDDKLLVSNIYVIHATLMQYNKVIADISSETRNFNDFLNSVVSLGDDDSPTKEDIKLALTVLPFPGVEED